MRKVFGRLKAGKGKAGEADVTKERVPAGFTTTTTTTNTTTTTPPSATDGMLSTAAASVEQKPELYSTAGSTGIRVVAEPADAVLEYIIPHVLVYCKY